MSIPEPPFALTDIERRSALWQRLKDHLAKRLEIKRGKNDGPMNSEETLTVRGHIECLKGLLELDKERISPPKDGS